MNSIIKIINLSKNFLLKKNLKVLKNISIEIKKGEIVALLGPSGSGKSTFLHLIALLDQPSGGEIYFEGKRTSYMTDFERDQIRANKISIVYQQNNLLNDFTSLENVAIAMISSGKNRAYAILILKGLCQSTENRKHASNTKMANNTKARIIKLNSILNI